jgi:hypothetical protein
MIQHSFDVMDCEKNLVVNIMKTIFGEKDIKKVCQDLESLGICSALWLEQHLT